MVSLQIAQVCPRYYPYIGGVETHVKKISEKLYDDKGRLRDEFSFEHGEQGKWKIHQKLYDERGKVIVEY